MKMRVFFFRKFKSKKDEKENTDIDIYNVYTVFYMLQAATSLREECHKNNIEVISYGSFLLDPNSEIKHLKVR